MPRIKRSKPDKGCCNCLYSAYNRLIQYHCGRKAGESIKVSEKQWLKTDCPKWEYDGVSEGFDPEEEYNKMPDEI